MQSTPTVLTMDVYQCQIVRYNINALRISDLLKLMWKDVLNEKESFKVVKIKEGKTEKKEILNLTRKPRRP